MSELKFYEETHQYELDGELLPSVSEIIRFISREHYADINPVYIERAAERGTRIHKACEQLDLTGECECDEDIEPYVQAYANCVSEHDLHWTLIEEPMYHPTMHYAGTLDRVEINEENYTITDIKSSAQPYMPAVIAQLGGYGLMLAARYHIDAMIIKLKMLQPKKDGTYKLVAIGTAEAYELFEACYKLYIATHKKKRRKRNGD